MPERKPRSKLHALAAAQSSTDLMVKGAMLTHPGLVRTLNEDVVAYRVPHRNDPLSRLGVMALVADGMGGHAAGEVASQIAAHVMQWLYYQHERPVPEALAVCFAAANQVIYDRSRTIPECAGMGTTCTVLIVRDNCAWLGHVGDSRAYIVRDATIFQISEDHSVVAQLVREGTLSAEEARVSPERNLLLRALGTRPAVQPAIWEEGLPLRHGDILVLCSDGLCDLVSKETICQTVTRLQPFEACQSLVDAALGAGGHDNVSVGVLSVADNSPAAVSPGRSTRKLDLPMLQEAPQ